MKKIIGKNKRIIISFIAALFIGIVSQQGNMTEDEYKVLLSESRQLSEQVIEINEEISQKSEEVNQLQAHKDEIDRQAREEAERKAREEADRQAREEAERKAQEEAARIAQEEAARAQQSNNYVTSSNNNNSYSQQGATQGATVWLTATGSKYHSNNNCGNTNSNNARSVSRDEAISQGYTPCKKCY